MKPTKIALLKQLRAQYPISITQCSLFLDDCQLEVPCTELKIKNYLIEQLVLKTKMEVPLATQMLEKQGFDVEKVLKNWKDEQTPLITKILQKKGSSEDKIWLIFCAIQETSTRTSQLLVDFYFFCERLYDIDYEGCSPLRYKLLLALAKKMKLDFDKGLKIKLKKSEESLWQSQWKAIEVPIYDALIGWVKQNVELFQFTPTPS